MIPGGIIPTGSYPSEAEEDQRAAWEQLPGGSMSNMALVRAYACPYVPAFPGVRVLFICVFHLIQMFGSVRVPPGVRVV